MKQFLDDYYDDTQNCNPSQEKDLRVAEVIASIEETGEHEHTGDELRWAAKTAWRNAARCPGRNIWKTLYVVDERSLLTCQEIFEAICNFLSVAFNGGKIVPSTIIFRQRFRADQQTAGIRVWNGGLLSFAGFVQENGDVIGDPKNVSFTDIAITQGWKPRREQFEFLPLILTDAFQNTELFEFPDDIKGYTINLSHPDRPEIANMALKWYSFPLVSSMMLEAGGIQYTCCPIAGYFQDTEISVMNLLATSRYNLLEPIGRALKLDVSRNSTYWKCVVGTELTRAVFHSFTMAGVSIVDHMTLADTFCSFMQEEVEKRGGCPSDWVWVVPPMSSGLVPSFHCEMLRYSLSPSYEYQCDPQQFFKKHSKKVSFKAAAICALFGVSLMSCRIKARKRITLAYATEGGTALSYAKIAESIFIKAFAVSIVSITNITNKDAFEQCIDRSEVVIFVVSTFGEGGAPTMAQTFEANMVKKVYNLFGMKYAVFRLGSSQYIKTFAKFGKLIDAELEIGGGKRLTEPCFADDQANQKKEFEIWINKLFLNAVILTDLMIA